MQADISESVDLASQYPDIVAKAIAWMEESHTENDYWPSTNNTSMKCCAACYNANGCAAPCKQIPTPPSPPAPAPHCPKASNTSIPLSQLAGTWIQEGSEHVRYEVAVDVLHLKVSLGIGNCTDCCWTNAFGSVSADGRVLHVVATGPSCHRNLTGEVCDTGNELQLLWSERWSSWYRQEVFDFD